MPNVAAEQVTSTITFADQGWTNAQSLVDVTANGDVFVVNFSYTGSLPPKYYVNDKTARIYKDSDIKVTINDTFNYEVVKVYATTSNGQLTLSLKDGVYVYSATETQKMKSVSVVYNKPDGPVDFTYPYETSKTLVFGTDEEYTIPMPFGCPANIKWTSSDTDEAVIMLDGPFLMVAGVGTAVVTATWEANEAFNAGSFEYTINVVAPPAAGTPVVSINGKALEANAFYNVTKGAVATITSENAKVIYVYNENFADIKTLDGASGEFTLEIDGEYVISSSNGIDENEGISINFKLVKPEEPVEPAKVYWSLINNVADITEDGEYLIVGGGAYTMSNEDSEKNRKSVGVTIVDNVINELPSTAMPLNVEIVEGKYYWTVIGYAGSTDQGNYLVSSTATKSGYLYVGSKGDTSESTVSFTGNDCVIQFEKGANRTLRYNPNTSVVNGKPLFATYVSGQDPIQLYKKIEPKSVISLSEYLPKIGETEHLAFANDEVAKKMTFTSLIPGVKFHHCTEKIAAPNRMMHRAPAAATWAELENGEYDHSDNANGTHIWVKAVKESPVNEATIESPEFWQFILPEGITTGIDSVAAEESGEVELYNLQGVRVDRRSAAPGLYIERCGGKVAKVVL